MGQPESKAPERGGKEAAAVGARFLWVCPCAGEGTDILREFEAAAALVQRKIACG